MRKVQEGKRWDAPRPGRPLYRPDSLPIGRSGRGLRGRPAPGASAEETVRDRPAYPIYQTRFQEIQDTVPANAEDTSVALFRMESGAMVNWMVDLGGYGSFQREILLGDRGRIEGFGTRGGRVRAQLAGQEERDYEALVEEAGRAMKMSEVEAGKVYAYQSELDETLEVGGRC